MVQGMPRVRIRIGTPMKLVHVSSSHWSTLRLVAQLMRTHVATSNWSLEETCCIL